MNDQKPPKRRLTRRNFLALGGGLAAAATVPGAVLARSTSTGGATPAAVKTGGLASASPAAPRPVKAYHLAATDGWIFLPKPPATGVPAPLYPDPAAPKFPDSTPLQTTYIFGFRNVTGMTDGDVAGIKGQAQASAPIMYFDEGTDATIRLTNLGLQVRPDLVDSHTIHWHGFRNAIPLFDGVPEMSIAVPISRDFTYFYRVREPGTYMYHCHFEDVEHVQMGMTGVVYVRPAMNTATQKYVYNDASTAYDREFVIFLTEIYAQAHWNDAHIQPTDWSDFEADFFTMNGRSYPDTLEAGGDPTAPGATSKAQQLQFQPISSLIKANAGERVLLRIVNLGYQQQSMTLGGLSLRVVGKDATLMKGRDGTDTSFLTNTVYVGPGESCDAIFTAPAVTSETKYLFYNRKYNRLNNGGSDTYGGQMTEVRISPAGTLPPQTEPNT